MANVIYQHIWSKACTVAKVEHWLNQFGVEVGDQADSELRIVNSANCGDRSNTHKYLAEVGGTANFDKSVDHLNEVVQDFTKRYDSENWPVFDIVLLAQEKGGAMVEGYWHKSEQAAFDLSSYGHEFQQVWVTLTLARLSDMY